MLWTFARAFVAGFFVFAANTGASAQVSSPGKVYPTIEVSTVTAILIEAGIPFQLSQLESGRPIISALLGPGKTVLMAPARCKSGPGAECYSLLYMAIGGTSQLPYASLGENLVATNFLNAMLDLSGIYMNPTSDNPTVVSVLNADYGVAKGNILATLGLQIFAADYAFGEMAKMKAENNTLSSAPSNNGAQVDMSQNTLRHLQSVVRPASEAWSEQNKTSQTSAPSQFLSTGGVVKSLFDDPTFQALLATEDFRRDFTYRMTD